VYREGADGAETRAFVRITPFFIACLVSGDADSAATASKRMEAWKTLDSITK
jgi:hypothetical protein